MVTEGPRVSLPENNPSAIRVCILSAIRFYRDGLAQLLGSATGITVLDAAAPTPVTLSHLLSLRPDVLLIDISSRDGRDAMYQMAGSAESVNVVAVAVSELDDDVHECARAGVAGYVTRDASLLELIDILTSAAHGELRCSPALSTLLRRELADHAAQGSDGTSLRLTSRELQIVRLMAEDLSNKQISRRLIIEVSTVKSHVHNILEKLQVKRRADAVLRVRGPRWATAERPARAP